MGRGGREGVPVGGRSSDSQVWRSDWSLKAAETCQQESIENDDTFYLELCAYRAICCSSSWIFAILEMFLGLAFGG